MHTRSLHTLRILALTGLFSGLSACTNVSVPTNSTPSNGSTVNTGSGSTSTPSASANPNPSASASNSPGTKYVLPPGTALYLPFDTEAPTEDNSRRTSWTTDRFGKANAAYSFTGEGSYFQVKYDLNPIVHPALTMSAWARYKTYPEINQNGSFKLISNAYVNADRSMGISPNSSSGKGVWAMSIYGESLGAAPVNENEWVQITAVYDQLNQRAAFYVNGEEIAQSNETKLEASFYDYFYVGGSPGYGEHFPGDIDDVRIYERALSKEEAKALYEVTKP
jgi:hypothetical protein